MVLGVTWGSLWCILNNRESGQAQFYFTWLTGFHLRYLCAVCDVTWLTWAQLGLLWPTRGYPGFLQPSSGSSGDHGYLRLRGATCGNLHPKSLATTVTWCYLGPAGATSGNHRPETVTITDTWGYLGLLGAAWCETVSARSGP